MTSSRIDRREALAALALLLLGCRKTGDDARPSAERVVSIAPSTTEAVFAIGAGERLVGRSAHCDFPPAALSLPVVGGYGSPSVEAIVALRPNLVIGERGPAGPTLDETLRARGIATFFPETSSIAQIEAMIGELGRLFGRSADAARVVAAIEARLDEVKRAVAGRAPVRAVLILDLSPIYVAGPGGFDDECIGRAGGTNLIDAGGAWPTIGLERLLKLDPDVILDASVHDHPPDQTVGVASLRDAPGWRDVRALREGRVRVVDSGVALRPGPRIAEGVVSIARALHGDGLGLGSPKVAP